MRKIYAAVIFIVSLLLFSCPGREPVSSSGGDGIKLALIVKRSDILWYKSQINGFEDRCGALGIQYFILDNKMDANLTLTNIDTLISRKVDGIALAVTEQKMSGIVVNRIFEAGIPLVSLNNKLIDNRGSQLAPHIGMDYRASAEEGGKWLVKMINGKGLFSNQKITPGIAELNSDSVAEIEIWTDVIREELMKGVDGLCGEDIYSVNSPANNAAGAMIAMQGLLARHPDVTNWVVYAGSSDEISGALRALDQVGMREYSIALSVESGSRKDEFKNLSGEAYIEVDTYEQGRIAADYLYDHVRYGVPIPSVTESSFRLIQ